MLQWLDQIRSAIVLWRRLSANINTRQERRDVLDHVRTALDAEGYMSEADWDKLGLLLGVRR